MKKIMEKPQSGHPKSPQLISTKCNSFIQLGHWLVMASIDLLAPATLGFHVR
jgi:hypothetical protein